MADKLLIVIANSDITNVREITPPLVQATVAAAMEYDVELLFTGQASQLVIRGVADKLINPTEQKSVHDYIRAAKAAGVSIKVCTPSMEDWQDELIAEIDETVGSAYMINEAMDDSVATLTY
ncbi:MAG: DsrE family protein [Gammaproteobacteria bacterium]|nr:DsrE family protein [Gammaproteobacteria bacterium]